jgi:hypothetical protein
MGQLIGTIAFDGINEPCDLATALRLLLQDRLDRDSFGIENPKLRYEGCKDLNYQFDGSETAFVFSPSTGSSALRVDVTEDGELSEIMPLIRRLGHAEALLRLLDDDRDDEDNDEDRDGEAEPAEPADPRTVRHDEQLVLAAWRVSGLDRYDVVYMLDLIRRLGRVKSLLRLLAADDEDAEADGDDAIAIDSAN